MNHTSQKKTRQCYLLATVPDQSDHEVDVFCLIFDLIGLHATGTFMCPRNASALRDGHIYVPADVIQSK